MNNPLRILKTLDGFLTNDTEMILFGKAAIVLGFTNAPEEYGSTLDVDGILPSKELETVRQNEQFWEAIEKTNEALEPEGLRAHPCGRLRRSWACKRDGAADCGFRCSLR